MASDNEELNERLAKGEEREFIKAFEELSNEAPQPAAGKKPDSVTAGGRTQWVTSDGHRFMGAGKTVKKLSPGLYDIDYSPDTGIFFDLLKIKTEDLLDFPHTNTAKVLGEIRKFWKMKDLFERYTLPHKRGILLWGPPGSGKSCTVAQIVQDVVDRGGIAVRFFHPKIFEDGMKVFRAIQPETPLVVIMEDLDALMQNTRESEILNILDGVGLVTHTVFIATTNFPEVLGERIVNRPSRFDKRYKIPEPSDESRKMYFEHLIGKKAIEDLKIDLPKWIGDTEGMSLAHLKELFVATVLLGDPYEEAIDNLKSMKEHISSEDDSGRVMGFGTDKGKRK